VTEYQKRTPERLIEVLRSHTYSRSWQLEAADEIERLRAVLKDIGQYTGDPAIRRAVVAALEPR
jgi:hypothetical protein